LIYGKPVSRLLAGYKASASAITGTLPAQNGSGFVDGTEIISVDVYLF
jgi:hypothetical protein